MENLETQRLWIRKFKLEDAEEAYKNWAGVKEIADMTDFTVHSNIEETKRIIQNGLGEDNSDTYTWAIVLKDTFKPIGFIRLYEISRKNKNCKIIWAVGKKWWNLGISVEALKEVIRYLLEEQGFNIIISEYYSDIEKIKSDILKQVGMIEEARLKARKIDESTGKIYEKIIYSIMQ